MKPRACVVVASELTVRAFLVPQLRAMQERYDLAVVVNTREATLLEQLGVNARLLRVPIERQVAVLADLKSLFVLFRIMRRERFDLVHSLTPKAGLLAMAAAWGTGVRVRVHTFTGQVWATRAGLSRSILKTMDRLTARLATFTLADSASQRDLLIRERIVPPDGISVLAAGSVSGVDADRFRPDAVRRRDVRHRLRISTADLVILYAGRLTGDKGVLDLAHAFTAVAAERTDVHLLMVGPDEQQLRPAIRRICYKFEHRLHFADFTHEPERYMAAADVLALPSYREGLGTVLIEAGAVGVPTVASRICGVADAVDEGRTALLHVPADISGLTACLRTLCADPLLRRRLGDAGRERAIRLFSPATLTSAVLDFYDRVARAEPGANSGWYTRVGKRAFDVAAACVAIAALAPLGALLALVIRIALGSPVFFRQRRPGLHGAPFEIVKFRTMTDRWDAAGRPLPDAERLTPLGRFLRSTSLDELPELWNVLKGEMSLVGPRPLLTAYLERYTPAQARRHLVRPGITGLAQVSGRNGVSWERKFGLDLEYVERCSLMLDAKILVLTVWQVVTRQGVNQPGQATAEEFMGTVSR
jgi:lipopolysaccharide/colanic/teichoic acid biosynthesis glycosyltransferase/glycosyltransferase involved in cell wall biosynthesis